MQSNGIDCGIAGCLWFIMQDHYIKMVNLYLRNAKCMTMILRK